MELVSDNGVGCDSARARRLRAELWSASPAQRCAAMCACVLPEDCVRLDAAGRRVELRRRAGIGGRDAAEPTLR